MILPADLRLRLVSGFILILALSQLRTLAVAAAALALAAAVALALGLDRSARRRLLHVEGFVALLFLSLPFTVAGHELFAIGPLTASLEGVSRAALVACKISASALVILILFAGIEPGRFGSALRDLRVPEPMVRMFVLSARYLGIMRDEGRRLHEAMRARGFRPRTGRHTWRSYGNLIGMLLVRALARGERVEEAMLCRGYSGHFPRLPLPRPAALDWVGSLAICGLAASAFAVDRLWA